jgi:hypothetical protein
VPRRQLLPLAALVLAVGLATGCADEVDPAARVGDATVAHDELMAEVEAWAGSPTLLAQLQVGDTGPGDGARYSTDFVDFVLTNRVSFELHNQEFESRGMELSDETLEEVRTGLFSDPNVTADVLDELGEPYAEQLVADVARQFEIQTALAEGYATWAAESFTRDDIEVSPRYGSWDTASGAVLAPEGPRTEPSATPFTGL